MFSVEQMQAAQQLNQEALGQEGFAQYNALIQKSTMFAMPLNKEEQKILGDFQKKISEARVLKQKEPKKQEFINMIEVMKSLGFKPAELSKLISGAVVKKAGLTLALGTFKLKDFGAGVYKNKPEGVDSYTVVIGATPKGQSWEAKFVGDFKKDVEKVFPKLTKEVKAELVKWEPMDRGVKAKFHLLEKFFAMFGINDDKTQKVTKDWVKKLGGKFPTDAEIQAVIDAKAAPAETTAQPEAATV